MFSNIVGFRHPISLSMAKAKKFSPIVRIRVIIYIYIFIKILTFVSSKNLIRTSIVQREESRVPLKPLAKRVTS